MKKLPTIFERDWDGDRSRVTEKPTEAHSLIVGATPTIKWDGTAVAIIGTHLYKRYDCKGNRTPPQGFLAAQEKDVETGHWPGWVPVSKDKPEDKWYFTTETPLRERTYEFCGPKVNGNPHGFSEHIYLPHGTDILTIVPVPITYLEIYDYLLTSYPIEGIVWWKDGEPVAKIKRRDFGLPWPVKEPINA